MWRGVLLQAIGTGASTAELNRFVNAIRASKAFVSASSVETDEDFGLAPTTQRAATGTTCYMGGSPACPRATVTVDDTLDGSNPKHYWLGTDAVGSCSVTADTTGNQVLAIENVLWVDGRLTTPDTKWTSGSTTALKAYQTRWGLSSSGCAMNATWHWIQTGYYHVSVSAAVQYNVPFLMKHATPTAYNIYDMQTKAGGHVAYWRLGYLGGGGEPISFREAGNTSYECANVSTWRTCSWEGYS